MISYKDFCHVDNGRIGNQIFQYSICKILSHLNNYDFYLNPNHCFLTNELSSISEKSIETVTDSFSIPLFFNNV